MDKDDLALAVKQAYECFGKESEANLQIDKFDVTFSTSEDIKKDALYYMDEDTITYELPPRKENDLSEGTVSCEHKLQTEIASTSATNITQLENTNTAKSSNNLEQEQVEEKSTSRKESNSILKRLLTEYTSNDTKTIYRDKISDGMDKNKSSVESNGNVTTTVSGETDAVTGLANLVANQTKEPVAQTSKAVDYFTHVNSEAYIQAVEASERGLSLEEKIEMYKANMTDEVRNKYIELANAMQPGIILHPKDALVSCENENINDKESWNIDLGPLIYTNALGQTEMHYFDTRRRGRKSEDCIGICANQLFMPAPGFRVNIK